MNAYANAGQQAAAYKNQQVSNAGPEQLTLMLYSGAARFVAENIKAVAEGRYDDAVRELETAWNYSDKQDRALADDLRTARMAAERAKNPPAEEPHHGRGVDWTQVITDVIIHSMDKG